MQQPLFNLASTISVAQLVRQIKDVVERDDILKDVWVRGEISNVSRPVSGHIYFTLKDREAAIHCVMWKFNALRLARFPKEGDAIETHGAISMYEARGDVQLYVDQIKLAGAGALWEEYERLRARLSAEGLFAAEHKRPLPLFPHTIGVVTSRSGAVLRDICRIVARRYPLAQILLAPTQVQGETAPEMIVDAIRRINHFEIDLLIVARGGGSIEDLWAFNDERVARAIYDSRVPVISGIGHETDYTIADFTADVRASTPSAAAEQATPDSRELQAAVVEAQLRIAQFTQAKISDARIELSRLRNDLVRYSPMARVTNDRQRVDDLSRRMSAQIFQYLALRREELRGAERHLDALNPQATLARGYAIVWEKETRRIVKTKSQVTGRKEITVRVSDGEFDATPKA